MKQVDIGSIDTLILCGGKGTRLQSILPDKPKILAVIGDSPFIKYLLNYLESEGIKRVILCTGYKHDQIEEWVRTSYHGDLDILFSREKRSMGTGGAIKNAEYLIEGDCFIVINGDTFLELNYYDFVKFFLEVKAIALLALARISDVKGFGYVEIDSKNRIISYREKPNSKKMSGLINGGAYVFSRIVLDSIPSKSTASLEYDIFPSILGEFDHDIYGFVTYDPLIDIGTPENLYKAKELLK